MPLGLMGWTQPINLGVKVWLGQLTGPLSPFSQALLLSRSPSALFTVRVAVASTLCSSPCWPALVPPHPDAVPPPLLLRFPAAAVPDRTRIDSSGNPNPSCHGSGRRCPSPGFRASCCTSSPASIASSSSCTVVPSVALHRPRLLVDWKSVV